MAESAHKRKARKRHISKKSQVSQNKQRANHITNKASANGKIVYKVSRNKTSKSTNTKASKPISVQTAKLATVNKPLPVKKEQSKGKSVEKNLVKSKPTTKKVATKSSASNQPIIDKSVKYIVTKEPIIEHEQPASTQAITQAPQKPPAKPPQPVYTVRGKPVRPWLVLGSLVFGFFMALLDTTVVNVAIPTIQTSLKTDLNTVSWVLNAYNLVFAVLLVTLGRFADQYGRKRLMMIGMVVFTVGSLLCSVAETIGNATGTPAINWLIGFRVLQGMGAAGLNTISLAVIISVFPANKRGAAIGVWGALSGLASAFGPVLGGFLVENFDWRYIFFVNLPFCIIGLIMIGLFVPETHNSRVSKRIDIPGMLFLTITIFCLVLAFIQGNVWGWSSPTILGLFAGSAVSIVLFVLVELKQKEPIIDFRLFKIVSFTGANITMFLFGIAIQGQFLMMVLFFQNARGFDQIHTAYAILPAPIAAFIISIICGRLSRRINPFYLGITAMFAIALGFFLVDFTTVDSSFFELAWKNVILGIGIGMIFQTLPSISLSEIPPAKLGVASGVFNTFRQVGLTLGIAVLLSVFVGQLQTHLPTTVTNSTQIVQQSSLPEQMKQSIITGVQKTATSSNATAEAGSSSSSTIDLTTYASLIPSQVPVAQKNSIIAVLRSLSTAINRKFDIQITNAFDSVWWISTFIALAGVISATLALILNNRKRSMLAVPKEAATVKVPVPKEAATVKVPALVH
ncbi:hypothetical protein ccbrp13_07090 [Ktedonobacteria bacterium brp13]|nr:hypothetical protein ccbrp13_07090 [Ktedonobacteria bacterium brp13]